MADVINVNVVEEIESVTIKVFEPDMNNDWLRKDIDQTVAGNTHWEGSLSIENEATDPNQVPMLQQVENMINVALANNEKISSLEQSLEATNLILDKLRGGIPGQKMVKQSSDDFDFVWLDNTAQDIIWALDAGSPSDNSDRIFDGGRPRDASYRTIDGGTLDSVVVTTYNGGRPDDISVRLIDGGMPEDESTDIIDLGNI